MKKEILGYIDALINVNNNNAINMGTALIDLWNHIDDMEESKSDKEAVMLNFNVALQNEDLKKRILELEDSCENMCQVQKHLQKKIDKLTGPKWVQD